jgi:hypothetical protein
MYKIPKQRYTQEFKQEAVRQVESEGKSPAHVARECSRICCVFRPETAIATRRFLKTKPAPCDDTCLASRIASSYRPTHYIFREQHQETLQRPCVNVGSPEQTALRAPASLGFLARAIDLAVAPRNWTVGLVESLGSEIGILPTKEIRR